MKRAVATDQAPKAIGPYSQAVRAGRWLFCSGQIGLDPASGELVGGGVSAETARELARLGEAWGVDTEPSAVEAAARRSTCPVRLGRLPDDIPFAPGSFDLVTAFEVLEHVRNPRVLSERPAAITGSQSASGRLPGEQRDRRRR
mgnify:CR=1 FL=1